MLRHRLRSQTSRKSSRTTILKSKKKNHFKTQLATPRTHTHTQLTRTHTHAGVRRTTIVGMRAAGARIPPWTRTRAMNPQQRSSNFLSNVSLSRLADGRSSMAVKVGRVSSPRPSTDLCATCGAFSHASSGPLPGWVGIGRQMTTNSIDCKFPPRFVFHVGVGELFKFYRSMDKTCLFKSMCVFPLTYSLRIQIFVCRLSRGECRNGFTFFEIVRN